MVATLDFSKGSLKGFFIVHLNNGNKIYAKSLFKFDLEFDKKILRCSTYFLKINGKGKDSMGEKRIEVENIEKIVVKGSEY